MFATADWCLIGADNLSFLCYSSR